MALGEFNSFKSLDAQHFSKELLYSLTKNTTLNPPTLPSNFENVGTPISNITKILELLDCKSILIEHDYTDRDYKSEFTALYSKRFFVPSARCIRLHFFSKGFSCFGKITKSSQFAGLTNEDYLGFCVVRPTEFNRIGRTVLKYAYPKSRADTTIHDVTCQAKCEVHLLDRKFEVFGAPFMQQDTQVGACAHAAIWMVGRYMNLRGYCGEFTPHQINTFGKLHQHGGRNFPAEDGLLFNQMLDALHGMNLYPIQYLRFDLVPKDSKQIKDKAQQIKDRIHWVASLIYNYIESGFPVIAGTESHVIVIIGHTLNISSKKATKTIERIPDFIVHDDLLGPYLQVPIHDICPANVITDLIAVLPNSVYLRGEQAEAVVHSFIKMFSSNNSDPFVAWCQKKVDNIIKFSSDYRLRTYLLKTSDFVANLRHDFEAGRVPPDAYDLVLLLDFPRYIWVSEIICSTTGKCIGKFILDSTAAQHDRSFLTILLESVLFLCDRRNLGDIEIQPLNTNWTFNPRDIIN